MSPKTGVVTVSEVKDYRDEFFEFVARMQKAEITNREIYGLVEAWIEKLIPGGNVDS